MHIDFHLEEESAAAAMENLVPKIVSRSCTVTYHRYSGKRDLLKKLPDRLRGYSAQHLPKDFRIVVLVDEDRCDCHGLKDQLELAARNAGLATKTGSPNGPFTVLNRIAVEELEAWFFGDFDALAAAFPRVQPRLRNKARYRVPDAVKGGTWECLERLL